MKVLGCLYCKVHVLQLMKVLELLLMMVMVTEL